MPRCRMPTRVGASFGDLFSQTLAETTGEHLVVKFRYRFGS